MNTFYKTILKSKAMLQIIPYIVYILACANGRPTGYTFTYSSNQNAHAYEQEEGTGIPENSTNSYKYGG